MQLSCILFVDAGVWRVAGGLDQLVLAQQATCLTAVSTRISGQGWCGHPGGTQEHPGTPLDLPTPQQSLLDLRIDVVKLLWLVGGCCGECDWAKIFKRLLSVRFLELEANTYWMIRLFTGIYQIGQYWSNIWHYNVFWHSEILTDGFHWQWLQMNWIWWLVFNHNHWSIE